MDHELVISGKYADAKVFAKDIEDGCVSQIQAMTDHPAFDLCGTGKHIAIMPDCHQGKGSVIGFTMPLQNRIVANVIGVDIGCGVTAVRFNPKRHLELAHLDKEIRKRIPMGYEVRSDPSEHGFAMGGERELFWDLVSGAQHRLWVKLKGIFPDAPMPVSFDESCYIELCKRVRIDINRVQASIGTLGGGNHYIEIGDVDGEDGYWLSVHSGSRQLGSKICKYWQDAATQRRKDKLTPDYEAEIARIREGTKPRSEIPKKIKEFRDRLGIKTMKGSTLDYLEGDDFYGYLWDMVFAQAYAARNREMMVRDCMKIIGVKSARGIDHIDTVHNYIDFEDLVIRKGAIRAHAGETMIIPLNMRDGSLICVGLGNEDWNRSAPHGAGRLFSRTHAKSVLSMSEAKEQMEGIYTSVIPLDEAPGAYRGAEVIEGAIDPTAKIVERVKPVLNIKDDDKRTGVRGKRKG